ncbi:MAG TPA: hypothetical protein QGF43_04030 [Acidimicrobiales bacterium]|jgi:hypothetical protein|nr:hypothetical protein [Actinomycetota bacterium]MDP6176988.1 hypothetical protein [Acidimicrobiales bacterium]MDP6281009.1 hypothetical protein [Acidimicrobiales bacterium]MDP7117631.1 hypothetical protein [Acidimicrobiales bacterium]MDP7411170.1 hypothetical protein [Acidimicrobiales bacterium]|tara:strand:+ start:1506 stop:1691 length:186 start_codon:yes stop_codon:yes gene_type:complete
MILETTGRLGVLAHEGGWDEILLVALPMCVLAGLLWMADRRARRLGRIPQDGTGTDQPDPE